MTGSPALRQVAIKAATLASARRVFRGPHAGSSNPICMSITSRAVLSRKRLKSVVPRAELHLDRAAQEGQNGDGGIGKTDGRRMDDLEIRHCRALLAVHASGGVGAAARTLGVAQSTVSETLLSL